MVEKQMAVEERLARIEHMLEMISHGVNQAPSMIAIATDSMDEIIGNAGRDGVSFEESLSNGIHLLQRLSDPKIAGSLNTLIDNLEHGPGMVSMAMDSLDESIGQANQGSVRLDDRINGLTQLLTEISDPGMIDKLIGLVSFAHQSSGLFAMGMDTVDEMIANNSENLEFINKLGQSLQEAQSQTPVHVGGIFGLMRTIKDPDRQKALGFLMNILKQFGKKL
jgi:uncharacterized protein YjgD (DUF1641 family)